MRLPAMTTSDLLGKQAILKDALAILHHYRSRNGIGH